MGTTREHTGSPKHALIRRPLTNCPECASANLEPIVAIATEEVHFLCATCGRCWRVELGYVSRVRPNACHGCPHQPRCEELYANDHARA